MNAAPIVRRFPLNTVGRDFAVGDIHGHFTLLQEALAAIGFDPTRDRLFAVGDLVDRGPECEQALAWLGMPWFASVRGNHDDYLPRHNSGQVGSWALNGGGWWLHDPRQGPAAVPGV